MLHLEEELCQEHCCRMRDSVIPKYLGKIISEFEKNLNNKKKEKDFVEKTLKNN